MYQTKTLELLYIQQNKKLQLVTSAFNPLVDASLLLRNMHKHSIFILFLTFLSCSTNDNKHQATSADTNRAENFQTQPAIIETEDEGWGGDIKLSYINASITDKAVIYKINSSYDNQNLGFEISVPKNELATMTIKSTGKNSDSFLHFLEKIYKQNTNTSAKFIDTITADCMNMGDYVDSLNKQSNGSYVTIAQYKLFFHGKNEDDYAELYLNVNDIEHQIEIKEKDEEYRPTIIKLLTKKSGVQ